MTDIDPIIQEKERRIATLQAEVARLKNVLPEPPKDSVVFAQGPDDQSAVFARVEESSERNWTLLVGPLNSVQGRGNRTTWFAIVEAYPVLSLAKWERLTPDA